MLSHGLHACCLVGWTRRKENSQRDFGSEWMYQIWSLGNIFVRSSPLTLLWTSTQSSDEHIVRFISGRLTIGNSWHPLYGFSGNISLLGSVRAQELPDLTFWIGSSHFPYSLYHLAEVKVLGSEGDLTTSITSLKPESRISSLLLIAFPLSGLIPSLIQNYSGNICWGPTMCQVQFWVLEYIQVKRQKYLSWGAYIPVGEADKQIKQSKIYVR